MIQGYQIFNKLSVRVFITMWLSIAVMISLTVLLPRFDQRRILPTPEKERLYYASKITYMLFNNPTDHYQDNLDDAKLIIIPSDISERYNAIHHIDSDAVTNFIINTLATKQIYQQEIDSTEYVGPFYFQNDPNAYYLSTKALPQSYYLSRIYDAPGILLILMLLISIPFAAILSWSLSIPMKKLSKAMTRVGRGDWTIDKHLEVQGPAEYRVLAKRFNKMIETLTNAREEKNRLFANLSHELRTPLTRIQLSNSLIRIQNIDSIAEEVQRIHDNLILVEERIQSMLSLSKKMMLNDEVMENITLSDFLIPLLEDAAFEAGEFDKKLNYSDIPDVSIEANLELVMSGLENIVRNAIYYATSKINIHMSVKGNAFTINIHDDGPGVLEKDLPNIFEPFYRDDKPEDFVDYGGSGLGLAIVSHMVELHKGKIQAINDNGLSITITLPLKQSE